MYGKIKRTITVGETIELGLTSASKLCGCSRTDVKPILYKKSSAVLEKAIINLMNLQPYQQYNTYTDSTHTFVVSFGMSEECGQTFYKDIKLWKRFGDDITFINKLNDMPAMLLDLDRDNELDILYESQFSEDPSYFITPTYPRYEIRDGEIVWAGCGC